VVSLQYSAFWLGRFVCFPLFIYYLYIFFFDAVVNLFI